MGDENVFLLFPKELWEMILDRVEDSKDVLQVFKAYPDLDTSFENKKRLWLVGQVIRILMSRFDLKEKDILNCRLVCKQWKVRVDCALETQAVLQAYHLEGDKKEKDYWKPVDHWKMLNYLEQEDYMVACFSKRFFGGVVFNSDFTNLAEFLNNMECYSSNENPFVGKILTIVFSNDEDFRPVGRPPNEENTFWTNCFRVLERFGSHVWYLNLYIDDLKKLGEGFEVNPPLGIWNTILQVLARLPHLKSVSLDTYYGYSLIEMDKVLLSNSQLRPLPPSLPKLESLSILHYTLPNEFINPILTSFGSQLRRLDLAVGYWRGGMSDLFKNLTELEINCDIDGYAPWTRSRVPRVGQANIPISHTPKGLIPSLTCPRLVKLKVSGSGLKETELGVESEVFEWLRKFPVLRYLNIGDARISINLREENSNAEGPIEKFPTLEHLSIRDSGKLSFNFLRSFPSLRELNVFIDCKPLVTDLSIPNWQIRLREQLQTLKMYDSNIWEHLPKLISVDLYEIDRNREDYIAETYKFSREWYEKSRMMLRNTDEGDRNEFNELRKHIQRYLGISDDVSESSDSSTIGSLDDDFDVGGFFG